MVQHDVDDVDGRVLSLHDASGNTPVIGLPVSRGR